MIRPCCGRRSSELAAAADVVVEHRLAFRPADTDWIGRCWRNSERGLLEVCSCGRVGFRLRPAGRKALLWFCRAIRLAGRSRRFLHCSGPPCSTSRGRRLGIAAALKGCACRAIRQLGGPARVGRAPGCWWGQTVELQASGGGQPGPPPASVRCKAPTCCWRFLREQGGLEAGHASSGAQLLRRPLFLELCYKGAVAFRSSGPLLPIHSAASRTGGLVLERLSSSWGQRAGPGHDDPAPTAHQHSRLPRQRPPPPRCSTRGGGFRPWRLPSGSGECFILGLGHAG